MSLLLLFRNAATIPVVDTTVVSCEIKCGPECEWIFGRLRSWPLIDGGTRVEWAVHPQFEDAMPYTFQLQMGRTGNPDADDWCDVGLPVTDTYFAVDDTQRVYGKFPWTHYRVLMTTSEATYASKPIKAYNNMSKRDWLRAREITRLETIMFRKESGTEGYLLKRRHFGTACDCVDSMTGEPRKHNCPNCYGTGILNGYYDPYPCFYVDADLQKFRNEITDGRGTTQDGPRVFGRMLNDPQLFSYDVWVDRYSDHRWMLHRIVGLVEIGGVPVVVKAEMRLLPFSHPVYDIPIAGQIPS